MPRSQHSRHSVRVVSHEPLTVEVLVEAEHNNQGLSYKPESKLGCVKPYRAIQNECGRLIPGGWLEGRHAGLKLVLGTGPLHRALVADLDAKGQKNLHMHILGVDPGTKLRKM